MERANTLMPRKPKDDTPKGGWDCPGVPDLSRKPTLYADGVKSVRGRLEWKWKPVDDAYLHRGATAPKIRVRTRKS